MVLVAYELNTLLNQFSEELSNYKNVSEHSFNFMSNSEERLIRKHKQDQPITNSKGPISLSVGIVVGFACGCIIPLSPTSQVHAKGAVGEDDEQTNSTAQLHHQPRFCLQSNKQHQGGDHIEER